jgi:hypothetical protein
MDLFSREKRGRKEGKEGRKRKEDSIAMAAALFDYL